MESVRFGFSLTIFPLSIVPFIGCFSAAVFASFAWFQSAMTEFYGRIYSVYTSFYGYLMLIISSYLVNNCFTYL